VWAARLGALRALVPEPSAAGGSAAGELTISSRAQRDLELISRGRLNLRDDQV